ncbi:LytR/AlgR family response regulator transcription factor [Arcticibacter sp. MXS-1]|uniref:LytR/AlgR family response regulator transcription factor n=1 Tax=Arcticibacter sp. MXS-1 TaxID=3341726 RepID=UPI0035A8D705
MNCLVVDDEKLALELLEDNVRQVPFLNLAASCRNAVDALSALQENKIDLIFLDIRMPGLNGLEFIQTIQKSPLVILVTAFEHHALEAFNLNAVDYLVKPVAFTRFLAAANKAHDIFTLRQISQQPAAGPANDHIFVNAGYSLVKVRLDDILFIEGLRDYVRINLNNGQIVTTRLSMRSLEEKLDAELFMRVHKSFIIALDKIEAVQKYRLVIKGREIPVGESYRNILQTYITERNI